ncbi:MAG: tetratricopeptide repeat protein, partial [Phycisphaerales bacterium]
LVMEYVEGKPLSAATTAETYPLAPDRVRETVSLMVKIAEAVAYAHQRGVIHRDLKPGNIFLDAGGEPRVLDFGLAKSFAATASEAEVTIEGQFVGSLQWSSPEQLGGEHLPDVRSDVYSLGLILYFLLAGRTPYALSGDIAAMVATIGAAERPSLSGAAPSAGADLDAVCATALARDPAARYQSVAAFADDLSSWLRSEPIRARRDSSWRKLRRRAARARWALTAAGGIVTALALALIVSVRSERRIALERDAAQSEARKLGAVLDFVRGMLAAPDPGRDGAQVRVVDVLDRAAAESATALEATPAVGAAVRTTLATAQTALGRPREGLALAESALELAKRGPGDRSTEAGAAILEMANAHYELGEFALAEREALLAAEIVGANAGDGSESHMECLAVAAAAMSKVGRVEESLPLKRRILEQRRATKGLTDVDTLAALNNLAVGLTAAKHYEEAGTLLEEAVAALRSNMGEEHPYTIAAASNLASILKRREKFEESAAVLARAYSGAKSGFGENHFTTLIIAGNYADSLVSVSQYPEAIRVFRDTASRQAEQLGPGHPATITTRMNLGTALRKSGDLAGAIEQYRATLKDAEAMLPAGHERISQLKDNLRETEAELPG